MMNSGFTLQTYMQEITPIVEEMEAEKQFYRDFEQSLHNLNREARRCNDNLSIYLAWQDNIARELEGSYTDEEILELHGYARSSMMKVKALHQIIDDDGIQLEFYLCNHNIYTPLGTASRLNQCLRCE